MRRDAGERDVSEWDASERDASERDASAHSERVRAHLVRQVDAAGGFLPFEQFMESVLYAPGLGYYSAGAHKLGVGGDFTTAPEISALFGACVAVQCAEIFSALDRPSILEIGAGSGRLAVDVLTRLDALGQLPESYWVLEVSADLRERQRALIAERLPHLLERVRWLDRPLREASFDGVVLANEVLDALPVLRFQWQAAGVDEFGVAVSDGGLAWAARPAAAEVAGHCAMLNAASGGWDDGYVSEYCPRLAAWTSAVTQSVRRGAVLWFDYGLPRAQYYLPERQGGTLICHFRHAASDDALANLGLQDLSAWVDFTAVAESSRVADFELGGFTTQAHFLAGLGIDLEMQSLAGGDEHSFARLAKQARRLMLPGEMGERFKAMAWLKGIDEPLRGFALNDLRHSL